MGQGPLRDPRLLEIESKLNAGRFDEAQRLLATIFDVPGAELASAYFATRILYQRGRLDQAGVVERLRELMARASHFPEAQRMLDAAEAGVLEPAPDVFRRVTGAPQSPTPARSPEVVGTKSLSRQDIPRAPHVPRFTPRAGVPSYVPETPQPPPQPSEPQSFRDREAPTLSAPGEPLPVIPSLQLPKSHNQAASTLPPPEAPPVSREEATTERPLVELEREEKPTRPHAPSLFEIAAALEAGHPARALELCERVDAGSGPELTLLAARALAALGERERAGFQLERLLRAPLIEPLVRAASARVLIEIGRPEQALPQARRAVLEDPDDPVSRVTCAWALVRVLRRTGNLALAEEAEPLLTSTRLREGPIAGLSQSLRAALYAEVGDAARAISLAQTALQQDPRQLDALAAIAVASARLGLRSDASRAQLRLSELHAEEAAVNAQALKRHGFSESEPAIAAHANSARVAEIWGEAEAALLEGRREPAAEALGAACAAQVNAVSRRGGAEGWSLLARVAARLFTELPVFSHFAPYDCSIFSVDRLDAALSLIYGKGGQGQSDEAIEQLVGAYVGESFRQAFGAEWHGVPAFPLSATIEGVGISARPCERVRARLREGTPLSMEPPRNLHPGADPLGNSVPLSLCPPAPWDPAQFPDHEQVHELGRLLPHSVVGLYSAQELELPLDHSVSGTVAIDRYVALLVPPKAPPDPDASWTRRVAILLGGYLGETLVDAVGAHWEGSGQAAGHESYRLVLPHGTVTQPVTRVLERLSGRRVSPLSEYVTRLASGRLSVPA
ncbi:MAG TPA: hypothetical protein VG937_36250 [Polyangiaceae bacterium]|nr:hypothetical protein [Polyangiaceae bacterium]